jgi:hypothetical protein
MCDGEKTILGTPPLPARDERAYWADLQRSLGEPRGGEPPLAEAIPHVHIPVSFDAAAATAETRDAMAREAFEALRQEALEAAAQYALGMRRLSEAIARAHEDARAIMDDFLAAAADRRA